MKFEITLIKTETIQVEADDSQDAQAIAEDLHPGYLVSKCVDATDDTWNELEVLKAFYDGHHCGYEWLTFENRKYHKDTGGYVPGGPMYFQYHDKSRKGPGSNDPYHVQTFHISRLGTAWRQGWVVGIDEYNKSVEKW